MSSNRCLTAAPSSAPASPICVRDTSNRRSVASIPQADSTAATRGTTTRASPSWRAMSVACSPAAPPNANSANRRGSTPRRTETSRTPSAMFVLTMRWMPRCRRDPVDAERGGDRIDGALGRRRGRAAGRRRGNCPGRDSRARDWRRSRSRCVAALAVAGRSRHRAGAFRPDMQDAAGIDPRDRAAAGADAGDVEAVQARCGGRRSCGS